MKKLLIILSFLVFSHPALAGSPYTLTIVPAFREFPKNFGKDEIHLSENTDHFNVVLKNTSDKIQNVPFATCSQPLISSLSFSLKDRSNKTYTISCGPQLMKCSRNIFKIYPLLPEEMFIFEISPESCQWDALPDTEKTPDIFEMQAIYETTNKITVQSEWKYYLLSISIPHQPR